MSRARLRVVLIAVAVGVAAWTAPFIAARATYFAHATADEPHYLMTAMSIGEDLSLDVSDERAAGRYRVFHQGGLRTQEARQPDGTMISPHDPGLPVLLALPMLAGGWIGAKLALAGCGGVLAALMVWVAHRRFAVPMIVAVPAVLMFSLAAPLAIYSTQVYPEIAAALAVTVAIAALTGPLRTGGLVALALAVGALPWLSVKYTAVAATLAILGCLQLLRAGRTRPLLILAVLGVAAGFMYLAAHQVIYGGWTVYAAGTHFVDNDFGVVGRSPDYLGRSVRLIGLLVDRGFGLAAWQPAFLLGVAAIAALCRRRPPGWAVLVTPLAVGWLNATFVALTMHGWWWPGRQVVVVLPAVVIAVAWWAANYNPARRLLPFGLAVGAAISAWLLVDVLREHHTLIRDFEATSMPLVVAMRFVLPDLRTTPSGTTALLVVWIALVAALALWGWRSVAGDDTASKSSEVGGIDRDDRPGGREGDRARAFA